LSSLEAVALDTDEMVQAAVVGLVDIAQTLRLLALLQPQKDLEVVVL
jgi:hypothetical protein